MAYRTRNRLGEDTTDYRTRKRWGVAGYIVNDGEQGEYMWSTRRHFSCYEYFRPDQVHLMSMEERDVYFSEERARRAAHMREVRKKRKEQELSDKMSRSEK